MDRRQYLHGTTALLGIGSGCFGVTDGGNGPSAPRGTFEPLSDLEYWEATVSGSKPTIATTDDALFVATDSARARIEPDGTLSWDIGVDGQVWDIVTTDETMYTAGRPESDARVVAYDTSAGTHRWERTIDFSPSLVGTTEKAVFVGTTSDDPAVGNFPAFAFDADSGQERWQTEVGTEMGATLGDDLCFVWTYDTLSALDIDTGTIRWQRSSKPRYGVDMQVVGRSLCLSSEAGVKAYSLPDGAKAWTRSYGNDPWIMVRGPAASPIAGDVVVGTDAGQLDVLDVDTGDTRWSVNRSGWGNGGVYGVEVHDGSALARIGDVLARFDAASGDQEWTQSLGSKEEASRRVHAVGDSVFTIRQTDSGSVFVETFDFETGRRQWQQELSAADSVPAQYGVVGDSFVVITVGGHVYGFPTTGVDSSS